MQVTVGTEIVDTSPDESRAEEYKVVVRLLAVHCFDAPTNREVNLALTRSYGLEGLARHLAGRPPVTLVVGGLQVKPGDLEGNTFVGELRVPRRRVHVLKKDEQPAVGDSPDTTDGNSQRPQVVHAAGTPNRQGEYELIIAQLEQILVGRLEALERQSRIDGESRRELNQRIVTLRGDCDEQIRKLAREIRDDPELVSIGSDLDPDDKSEVDQLLADLAKCHKRMVDRYDQAGTHAAR